MPKIDQLDAEIINKFKEVSALIGKDVELPTNINREIKAEGDEPVVEEPKEIKPTVEEPKATIIVLGEGFELRDDKDFPNLLRLYDRDKPTGVLAEIVDAQMSEAERVSHYQKELRIPIEEIKASRKVQSDEYNKFVSEWFTKHPESKPGDKKTIEDCNKEWEETKKKIKPIPSLKESLFTVVDHDGNRVIRLTEKEVKDIVSQKESVDSSKSEKEEMNMGLNLSFLMGDTFKDSKFVAAEGTDKFEVLAGNVVPLIVQQAIEKGDPNVCEPEDIINQLKEKCTTIAEFKEWAKRRMLKNKRAFTKYIASDSVTDIDAAKKKKKEEDEDEEKEKKAMLALEEAKKKKKVEDKDEDEEKKEKAMLDIEAAKRKKKIKEIIEKKRAERSKRRAEWKDNWSMNPKEAEELKGLEHLTVALNEKEMAKDSGKIDLEKAEPSKVRKYFDRLPDKAVGGPVKSLEPKEAAKVAEMQKRLAEKEAEIAKLKNEQDKKERSEYMYKVMSDLKSKDMISSEKEESVLNFLAGFDKEQLKKLSSIFALLTPKGKVEAAEAIDTSEGNISQIYETIEEVEDVETTLKNCWNK